MKNSEVRLTHEFVENIPDNLDESKIYVSIPYATVAHKCCCGCGKEVITPLSPTDWKFIFDGQSFSLDPSIGNWSFDCKSHYWIKNNKVIWAFAWSEKRIERGRTFDRLVKNEYFESENILLSTMENKNISSKKSLLSGLRNKWKYYLDTSPLFKSSSRLIRNEDKFKP